MGRRKGSRRIALEILYAHEVGGFDVEEISKRYSSDPAYEFARRLVDGVLEHLSDIDEIIGRHAHRWIPERMPVIDLSLLRMGVFEILHLDDVPLAVTIDEAVELAKTYSTEDSGSFINGVLAAVAASSGGRNPPTPHPM